MVANKNLLNISAKDHLRGSITSTNLTLPIRLAVFNGIFQSDLTTEEFLFHDGGLQAWYSDWFEEQCQAAANQISVQTHQELLHILNCLQSTSRDTSRIQVATNICAICSSTTPTLGLNPSDAKLNASLTLAARIWSSVAIDSLQHFFIPGYFTRWDSDQCLSDALGKELCPKPQTHETVKLPKVFTAANLEKIAGIQVQWTSNLADHLALKDDDKIVMFFHQASFLELSKKSKMYGEVSLSRAPLPPYVKQKYSRWLLPGHY